MKLEITVLVDNKPNPNIPQLQTAHGLSLLLNLMYDKETIKILFDSGPSPEVLKHNANTLKVNLNEVDMIFISHGHYDHADGVTAALGKSKPVIVHPEAFKPRIRLKPYLKFIGIRYAHDQLKSMGGLIVPLREPIEIAPNVYVSGEITGDRRIDERLYVIDERGLKVDPIIDEQYLFMNVNGKKIMIVGCSHPGIEVMVEHCLKTFKVDRIDAIIGGLHLAWSSEDYIKSVALKLKDLNVNELYPGHCTGDSGIKVLKEIYGDKCKSLYIGLKLNF